jgi:Leucine-rich repeat (LRR) protein
LRVSILIFFYSSNKLVALPEAISNCTKIETLNACNNLITSVPHSYISLKNLKTVNLSNNQITEFPTMLCGLTHLDMLDLSKNKITSVPAESKNLYCTELNLNMNQISSIAEELSQCSKLKTLRLEENCLQITSIPVKLLSDSVISNISVDGNLFSNKQFTELEGYKKYEERYTLVKKKMF